MTFIHQRIIHRNQLFCFPSFLLFHSLVWFWCQTERSSRILVTGRKAAAAAAAAQKEESERVSATSKPRRSQRIRKRGGGSRWRRRLRLISTGARVIAFWCVCFLPSTNYPLYDFDLRATHARTLLPAALTSVSFGFVLVRVRVRAISTEDFA